MFPPTLIVVDNRSFKRLSVLQCPQPSFFSFTRIKGSYRNEETSFCIIIDKFLFHKEVHFLLDLTKSLFFPLVSLSLGTSNILQALIELSFSSCAIVVFISYLCPDRSALFPAAFPLKVQG